ncbi:MAG TPA: putative lipid II flippase FtsW [Acidimicrobiales bacterium]|nr:putative lipid II flippase FtsW [Acidimicrobiales bacterium]
MSTIDRPVAVAVPRRAPRLAPARVRRPGALAGPEPGRRTAPIAVRPVPASTRRTRAVGAQESFVLLLGLVGLLTVIGLVMVLSASSGEAALQGTSPWVYFERQVLWVAVGTIALATCAAIDYRRWRRFAMPLLLAVVGMLVAVCVPGIGIVVSGSRRWLGFGQWQFQPSELAKFAMTFFAADLLVRRADRMHDTRFTFRPVALVAAVMTALIMKQPDMGTTVIVVGVAAAILWAAGSPKGTLVSAGMVTATFGALLGVVAPYRLHRLLAFLHPERDKTNTGYQAVQARMAMAGGRLFGVGLGAGREKTGYLPNAHTDFIFAVIGEEVGLVGCLVVVALFLGFVVLGVRAAARAPDRFGALVATGITAWIVLQALVNIGAVVGLLPVTGVPLPFVSFGGSSTVIAMAAIGVLANITRQGT